MADAPPPLPPVPTTYRERLAQFKILEEKRFELIEELLEKLEKAEARLAQTELDLKSEQNVRRRLQTEVVEAKERESNLAVQSKEREAALVEKQSRKPFVLVLIDADAEGYMFQDKYITRRAQGGEALADELLVRIREYLRPLYDDADSLDILVRVYANLEGMANILVRDGKVRNLGQLRAFATGFCGRIAGFDWVDVGIGKEGGSARKVRENLHLWAQNVHLRHLILGLSPSQLPSTFLTTLSVDALTLISPVAHATLKTTPFPSLFTPPPKEVVRTNGARSSRGGPALQLTQQEDPNGGSTWLVIRPERSGGDRRSKSHGGGAGRRSAESEDDEQSSLSISIGPDNSVMVDSGRRRR
ncbi:hypothetical protein GQ43DRAFT_191939 [Delitschia confertaspora ATCC 74209]|uniref:DUF7923 domain-containing protein n=1 Tax=Delitschia confertaspora ATCC 74209 TaxID=1513339 RepID=A0A9P4MYF9_9PLEO|nr:hypothetical protein GQ43DRAFT_191939 [Delitschia confertaspora ATCC 74209]